MSRANCSRSSVALDQLSTEIPPAMLAGVLGLKTSHVVRHTPRAGGDWAQYAAGAGGVPDHVRSLEAQDPGEHGWRDLGAELVEGDGGARTVRSAHRSGVSNSEACRLVRATARPGHG